MAARNDFSAPTMAASDDVNEWELIMQPVSHIAHAPNVAALRRAFQMAVKKIILLLFIRKHWAHMGTWLQRVKTHRRRAMITLIWNEWSSKYVRKYKHLFTHVHRVRGVLTYK